MAHKMWLSLHRISSPVDFRAAKIHGANSKHSGHLGHFLLHLLEMLIVMVVGMVIGGAIFTIGAGIAAGNALTFDEARLRHPEFCLLTIAVIMSVPMVAWMRHRGHDRRSGAEMTSAMIEPALALIGLYWLHAIKSEPLCGVYCAVMIPAMVVAMYVRRHDYAGYHFGSSVP